ncbi:579_t:CDS:1, partial [Dentiscutata heterogama]
IECSDNTRSFDGNEFMNNISIIQKNNDIYAVDFLDRTSFRFKSYSSSLQESQEGNDDYDERSNQGLKDGYKPPSKRQILIYDSNYTEAPDCNDKN